MASHLSSFFGEPPSVAPLHFIHPFCYVSPSIQGKSLQPSSSLPLMFLLCLDAFICHGCYDKSLQLRGRILSD